MGLSWRFTISTFPNEPSTPRPCGGLSRTVQWRNQVLPICRGPCTRQSMQLSDCCPCSHRVIVGISVECRPFGTRTLDPQRSLSTTVFLEGRALRIAVHKTPDHGSMRPHQSLRGAAVAPAARPAFNLPSAVTQTILSTRQEPPRC